MAVKVQIEGVGTVELDDSFTTLDPAAQQATIDEIAGQARKQPEAPKAEALASPQAPSKPRGSTPTYMPLGRFLESQFKDLKRTSDYRDPEHNRKVGGVEGSYHTTRQALDYDGPLVHTPEGREQIRKALADQGITPREFKYHRVKGGGLHLHIATDELPEAFMAKYGTQAAPQAGGQNLEGELRQRILRGDSDEALIAWAKENNRVIDAGDLAAFRKSGAKDVATRDNAARGEGPGIGHTALEGVKSLGRGVTDTLSMVPEGLASLQTAGIGKLVAPLGEKIREAYDAVVGKPDPQSTLERYTNATARGVGGAVVGSPLSKLLMLGGAVSGIGGEAAADAASVVGADEDTARTVGQIGGGIIGGSPLIFKGAGKVRDARFVGKQAKDPRAPFLAEVVEDLARVAKEHDPKGVVPKGRGPVTVQQIGDLERSYLVGVKAKISKLDIPEPAKQRLREAIERKHTISGDELKALRGTVEGDAVALGIQKVQALRDLTPPYNGSKPGIMGNIMEMGVNFGATAASGNPLGAVVGTLARKGLRAYPGDVNASRLDAARKAIKREKAYAKVAEKVGPSGQREAMGKLNEAYEQAVNAPKPAKARKRPPEDLAVEAHMAAGRTGSFGSTDFYANVLGASREEVIKAIDEIKVPEGFEFEAQKLKHGFKVRKNAQDALIPELRTHLGDRPSNPRSAPAKASPQAEGGATDERIYRPVEDASRYAKGKERAVKIQTNARLELEQELPQELTAAVKNDLDHIIDVERTGESALRYFDEKVAPRLKDEFFPPEIEDLRKGIERIVSGKRYQTDAQFEANVLRK